jgi:hypothetical protein
VSLFKDKIEQGCVNSCVVIKVRNFCCTRGTHRGVPLVQQKLLTFITAHEFTQPCSILSLSSDTMGAPSAAETSYLYQSTASLLGCSGVAGLEFNLACFCTWSRDGDMLSGLNGYEFTQPCSILSLNSDTMGAPSAAETSYLYQST